MLKMPEVLPLKIWIKIMGSKKKSHSSYFTVLYSPGF